MAKPTRLDDITLLLLVSDPWIHDGNALIPYLNCTLWENIYQKELSVNLILNMDRFDRFEMVYFKLSKKD